MDKTTDFNDSDTVDLGGAEEIRDPLDGLVEKAAADFGAPFMPEVLERLAALRKSGRAAFETLRSQLKKTGCRVTALDEAIDEESGEAGGRRPTQADILIELAQSAELFHAPDGTSFADLDINGHARPGRFAAKAFADGWRGGSSRRRKARPVPRPCNQH